MPTTLTREELYARVWAEPISRVSKTLGLSDVGLAKACRRHEIPMPGRGYWAKKQAGKRVFQPKLKPQSDASYSDVLTFPGPAARPSTPVTPDPLMAAEADPENAIVVTPDQPVRHPLLKATAEYWRISKRQDYRWDTPVPAHLNLSVSPTLESRALRILQALFDALDTRGHSLERGERGELYATVLGEGCELVLRERMRRGESGRPGDLLGTGELELRVEQRFGRRRHWRDSTTQQLEQLLNGVVVGLLEAARAEKEFRAGQERLRAEAAEKERERIEADRLRRVQKHEAHRFDLLFAAVERHRQMSEFLSALTTAIGPTDAESPIERWLQRLKDHVAQMDVLQPFREPQPSMQLFYLSSRFEIDAVLSDGFEDREPGYGDDKELPACVTLTDVRLRRQYGDSESVIVEMPEADALPYEVLEPDQDWRVFMFPAAIVNNYQRRRAPAIG